MVLLTLWLVCAQPENIAVDEQVCKDVEKRLKVDDPKQNEIEYLKWQLEISRKQNETKPKEIVSDPRIVELETKLDTFIEQLRWFARVMGITLGGCGLLIVFFVIIPEIYRFLKWICNS